MYSRETAPLLEYYRKHNLLAEIDGTGGREDILTRILDRLETPAP